MPWHHDLFGVAKPVIGMIHLPPLPGTALYDDAAGMAGIVESARRDAAKRRGERASACQRWRSSLFGPSRDP